MLKSSSSAASKSAQSPTGSLGDRKTLRNPSSCARACSSGPSQKSIGLRQCAGQEEEQHRLAAPRVEHVADRDVVAERLVTSSCRASRASRCASRPARTRGRAPSDCAISFSWCGNTRSRPPPWISKLGPRYFSAIAEHSMCQPGRPAPPRRVPGCVLARLVRLPQREVARILLERVRLLLLHLVGPLAREPAVPGVARDAEVDVALDLVREAASRSSCSIIDDLLGNGLGRPSARRRGIPRPSRSVSSMYQRVASRCELGAAPGRGVVDLVVDVRDVHGRASRRSRGLEPALAATSG